MVTAEEVRQYVNASVSDDVFIGECIVEGHALVAAYVGSTDIPQSVMDACVKQVSSELFHRRQAPSGIAQFSTMDGSPVRVARDPMTSVYSVLNRYVTMGV